MNVAGGLSVALLLGESPPFAKRTDTGMELQGEGSTKYKFEFDWVQVSCASLVNQLATSSRSDASCCTNIFVANDSSYVDRKSVMVHMVEQVFNAFCTQKVQVNVSHIYAWGTTDYETKEVVERNRTVNANDVQLIRELVYTPMTRAGLADLKQRVGESARLPDGHCIISVSFRMANGKHTDIVRVNLMPRINKTKHILLEDIYTLRAQLDGDLSKKSITGRLAAFLFGKNAINKAHFIGCVDGDAVDIRNIVYSLWFCNKSRTHDQPFLDALREDQGLPSYEEVERDDEELTRREKEAIVGLRSALHTLRSSVGRAAEPAAAAPEGTDADQLDQVVNEVQDECEQIARMLKGVKTLIEQHNAKEKASKIAPADYSFPREKDGKGGGQIEDYGDFLRAVRRKIAALEKERTRYKLACDELKSALEENETNSAAGEEGANAESGQSHAYEGNGPESCVSSLPRNAGSGPKPRLYTGSETTPIATSLQLSSSPSPVDDDLFAATTYSGQMSPTDILRDDPFVSRVREHIVKTGEEAKQMRFAIDTTYEALGGDTSIKAANPIEATKSLIALAGDTSESITQVKQLLDLDTHAEQHRVRMSNVLDGVRAKLDKVNEVQKEATAIVDSFTKPDEVEANSTDASSSASSTMRTRRVARKKKPMSPEDAAADTNMTLTSTLYFGVTPKSTLNLNATMALADITPESVRKFKRDMKEKLQQLEEVLEAMRLTTRLLRPSMEAPHDPETLIKTVLGLAQDGNKALTSTDEFFVGFPTPTSTLNGTTTTATITAPIPNASPSKLTLSTRTSALVEAVQTLQADNDFLQEQEENMQKRINFLLLQEETLERERERTAAQEAVLKQLRAQLADANAERAHLEEEVEELKEELDVALTGENAAEKKAEDLRLAMVEKKDSLAKEADQLQQDIEDLLVTKGAIEEVLGDLLATVEVAAEDLEAQESAMLTEVQRAESVLRLSATSAYAQEQKILSRLLEVIDNNSETPMNL